MDSEKEIISEVAGSDTLAVLNKSEIDSQVATAKQWPRDIKKFRERSLQMVTLTEQVAGECIYALPRGNKSIEGPSARFAEILVSNWGNCRAGARIVGEEKEFIIAQGVFHDLEANVAITYEVKRRITDKQGRRFKSDMIGVTANAACSIALRNSILKGIPKALWTDMYEAARSAIVGDAETMANKRASALSYLQKFGATEEMVLSKLEINSTEDIDADKLIILRGLATAIKDGDTTVELAFAPDTEGKPGGAEDVMDKFKKKGAEEKEPEKKEDTQEKSTSRRRSSKPAVEAEKSADPADIDGPEAEWGTGEKE